MAADDNAMTEDRRDALKARLKNNFLVELRALLVRYGAEIEAEDHYTGYPECGEDIRMTVNMTRSDVYISFDIGRRFDKASKI